MEITQTAPFGAWRSPVTSDLIVSKTVKLAEPWLAGDNVYWLEMRPEEQGRYVVVRCSADGTTENLIPAPFNARTRVHEYGGASYVVDQDRVVFSNFADQRIYAVPLAGGAQPVLITPEGLYRYADAVIDGARGRLLCIREDHSHPDREPVNAVVGVDLKDGEAGHGHILVSGADFYAAPRLSPDGRRLVWLCWNHPHMPWDGTELWLAEFDSNGIPQRPRLIAGGREESVMQPVWGADGLYFISDRTGGWNLYRWREGRVEPVVQREAEMGDPPWLFGFSNFGFSAEKQLVLSYHQGGHSHLAVVSTDTGAIEEIDTPYTEISYLRAEASRVVFLGGSPTEFSSIVTLDLMTRKHEVLRRACDASSTPNMFRPRSRSPSRRRTILSPTGFSTGPRTETIRGLRPSVLR